MNARVFQSYAAQWYWAEVDDNGRRIGEPHGPFRFPVKAASAARAAIVAAAERQEIVFAEPEKSNE
jgi:hypothetical protein